MLSTEIDQQINMQATYKIQFVFVCFENTQYMSSDYDLLQRNLTTGCLIS